MGKKIYYPAMFFADIVEYYGSSSTYLESIMKHNIAQAKRGKLIDLKNEVESLCAIKSKNVGVGGDKEGIGLLSELNNIKKHKTDQNKINGIDKAIAMTRAMGKIDIEIMEEVLSLIQLLSEEKEGRNGYSDTNIDRYMDFEKDALEEKNYNDIVKYLIEPQAQGDYKTLTKSLVDCINESKYNDLPQEKRRAIREYLCEPNFKSIYILRIFRILEKCSVGFTKKTAGKKVKRTVAELENEINVSEKLKKVLTNIWGEADAEGVGISQGEKNEIIVRAGNDLLQDYKFYSGIYSGLEFENFKGFQALIFYRLYNHIYYYKKRNYLSSEISEDLGKALAFFSFSILQRAIEHTEILLHPAAQISTPVYIGEGVMVGKQCKLEPGCILNKNVCLYPFNIYNTDIERQDIYIHIGQGTIFNKDVKVVGSMRVGEECVINKSILAGNSIDDNMCIDNNGTAKMGKERYLSEKASVIGGIL